METKTANSTNRRYHGQLTAKIAEEITPYWKKMGYDVLSDHGISSENVGKIVSVIKKPYHKEDELSQLDIAIVKQGSNQVAVLIEIEETTDKPKTYLGDIFGVLLGEYICFKRKEIKVGYFTTLIVIGINKTNHETRNNYIRDKATRVKTNLGTQNAKIGNILIKTYTDGGELVTQLPSVLDEAIKGEL